MLQIRYSYLIDYYFEVQFNYILDPAMKAPYTQNIIPPSQRTMPMQVPPSQHTMPPQPIDISLEEVGRPPTGGSYCQVKGCVTFQHQNLIPDGFPKRWTFKTSPPIVYLREILFAQSDPNQYANPGIHDRGLIYGQMQVRTPYNSSYLHVY